MTAARTRVMALAAAILTATGLLAACTSSGSSDGGDGPNTLRVVASSELADMAPILDRARKQIGVDVKLTEAGTLDASSDVASGKADGTYDAAWLSSNRYLSLLAGADAKVATSTKIMASPVLLGVRPAAAKRLGWTAAKPPTWAQIAAAVDTGKFRYAMTNPAASNSGFSTLVAVATSITGGGSALDQAKATQAGPQLRKFFAGQAITAGSTGWITDKFVADPTVDGLFSYESTLMETNSSGQIPGGLVVIAPSDGVITADYPLSLLASATQHKRDLYTKLVDWLRTADVQQSIMQTVHRRPLAAGVKPDAQFGTGTLIEVPFPATRDAVDALLSGYLNTARRPATTVYVLDVSGSMDGDRLDALKAAMTSLTATDDTSSFTSFHAREDVTLLPFSSSTYPPEQFTVPEKNPEATLGRIRDEVNNLQANGDTHLYEAVEQAYDLIGQRVQANPDLYPTIVVLTDGEANGDEDIDGFQSFVAALPKDQRVPVFTIRFGDANTGELDKVATLTGGKSFDGTKDLADAFRTIRGYQ